MSSIQMLLKIMCIAIIFIAIFSASIYCLYQYKKSTNTQSIFEKNECSKKIAYAVVGSIIIIVFTLIIMVVAT